jgi:pentapeptide repeat protein
MRVASPVDGVTHEGVTVRRRRRRVPALAALGLLAVAATACASASARERPAQKPEEQEIGLLFAPTAERGTMEPIDGTSRFELTLSGTNPQVVWFSDRPARQMGQIPIAEFADAWEGYGFVKDPPNAALAILGADESEDTVVVELGSPEFDEKRNTLSFPAEVLGEATGKLSHLAADVDQQVAESFGPASLFIDDATGQVINGCTIQAHMNCDGVDLHGADLSFTQMKMSGLRGVNLSGANLSYSDLEFSDLTGANLSGANLTSTRLIRAMMNDVDTTGATFCHTRMPDGSTTGC